MSDRNGKSISVIIPAKNEGKSLSGLFKKLQEVDFVTEIILVNDGSEDNTSEVCSEFNVKEIKNPYSKGNGAAIKSGARAAKGDILVFMDGDGQHQPQDISRLLEKLDEGFDMAIGARKKESQANSARWLANSFYNKFGSWMVNQKIEDLTSGFRAVRAEKFKKFLYLLPNGFSYPTTSTMAFFRAGYSVGYVEIDVLKRLGDSHINYVKDGIRFLLIIFKVGTLYSPLKIFVPLSVIFFILGSSRYVYTYLENGTFTNMSALLYSISLLVFLIGLVSEQITSLIYQSDESKE